MKKFVIQYWFWRIKWFEKDYEEIIIFAKSEKHAIERLRNICKYLKSIDNITEIPIIKNEMT
jgi:hypothetical protein